MHGPRVPLFFADPSKCSQTSKTILTRLIPNLPGIAFLGVISLTYLLAMFCSNESIKWVAYPTQALGKSCKIVPVMLFNVLVAGRKYSLREYVFYFLFLFFRFAFSFCRSVSLPQYVGSARPDTQ